MSDIQNIVLIGAGNVATHLGTALKDSGFKIKQVYSQTQESAKKLAQRLDSNYTSNPESIFKDADLYIVSVTDDAVGFLSGKLNFKKKLVVHTSGSLPLEVIHPMSDSVGVLYPLQTFSKAREVDFNTIPICIEADSSQNLERIRQIAHQLSQDVREVNSEQRKQLHLAAVFACNFPNFMYTIAREIVNHTGLDLDLLLPLIEETAQKIKTISPIEAQTGPALRGDNKVMEHHLEMLDQWPAFQEIYKRISSEILKKQNTKK